MTKEVLRSFDRSLIETIMNARKIAKATRKAPGVTTMDFIYAELKNVKSLLYSYLNSYADTEYIRRAMFESIRELKRERIQYPSHFMMKVKYSKTGEDVMLNYKATSEFVNYLLIANATAENLGCNNITVEILLVAIIQNPSAELADFLRKINVDIFDAQETFAIDNLVCEEDVNRVISKDMSSYLSILSKEESNILGRDEEANQIWNTLLKKTKRNVIIVGEPGVGKTAVVSKLANDIKTGKAPEEFKDFEIVSLAVSGIIANTMYRGQAETKFNNLIAFLKAHPKVILFIDEVHLIIGAGASTDSNMDLSNSLKPILASDEVRVIAATTSVEYERYFSKDPALKRRFEKIVIEEPNSEEVYPMLKGKIKSLSEYHRVEITEEMVKNIILYSSCFNNETKNPDRTLDLIDRSMVSAKRSKKAAVDKDCIISNFATNLKQYENMDANEKKLVAYHELGHYTFYRFTSMYKTVKPLAVSIIPAENYMGVTVAETRKDVICSPNRKAYITEIASFLAGGISENMVGEPNSGVSVDLAEATKVAYRLITETGLIKKVTYFDKMLTEKYSNEINEEIQEIIAEATTEAENVVKRNKELIDTIAVELLNRGILSNIEIEKIVNKSLS